MIGAVVEGWTECGPMALLWGDMFVPALSTNPTPAFVLHSWRWYLQCVVAGEVMLQGGNITVQEQCRSLSHTVSKVNVVRQT